LPPTLCSSSAKVRSSASTGCDRDKAFNIFQQRTPASRARLLEDSDTGRLPGASSCRSTPRLQRDGCRSRRLDPRKADITVRHLLNMASGIGSGAGAAERRSRHRWPDGEVGVRSRANPASCSTTPTPACRTVLCVQPRRRDSSVPEGACSSRSA
jgi:hypothetical protein